MLALLLCHGAWAATVDAQDHASVSVQATPVQRAPLAQPVYAYGVVGTASSNVTTISVPYVARIAQLRVQAGQSVRRGATLAVVEADPAAVLAARQAQSAVALAQGEFERTQSLYDTGLATTSQLATARKALLDARQAQTAQDEMGVGAGTTTVVAPFDGVVSQISVGQGDQIQAGAAILQLAATTGTSGQDATRSGAQPFAKDASTGTASASTATRSTAMSSATASSTPNHSNVLLGVEPSDATSVRVGDAVTIRGLSSALAKTPVVGHVVMVGASIDAQTQLVNVGVSVALGQTALIAGTRVRADIATHPQTYWIVPRAAVLTDDEGAYVFQIGTDHHAHRVEVATRAEDGDRYGVDGKLNAAQPVVVVGNYELKDGMAVKIEKSANGSVAP